MVLVTTYLQPDPCLFRSVPPPSQVPTPDWGLQHVLAPPLGHQARGRRPSIATPPFICAQLVEGEQDTRVEGEHLPGLKPTVRARRVLVLERMSLHVGPHSYLDWLPSSMTVADLSANRGLVSSRSRHLGYPLSPDTSSSKVLPLQTILPMSSDVVAKSKSKRSFDFERWARPGVIATSHMITKLAHARTFFRCIRCRCLGHQERHCHFRSSSRARRVKSSVQCDHPEQSGTWSTEVVAKSSPSTLLSADTVAKSQSHGHLNPPSASQPSVSVVRTTIMFVVGVVPLLPRHLCTFIPWSPLWPSRCG
jgi:hypothetical protein